MKSMSFTARFALFTSISIERIRASMDSLTSFSNYK